VSSTALSPKNIALIRTFCERIRAKPKPTIDGLNQKAHQKGHHETPQEKQQDDNIEIYRQLIRHRALQLIANVYPITQQLLGQAKWRSLFRRFFHEHQNQTPYYTRIAEELIHYVDSQRASNPALHVYYELLFTEKRLRFLQQVAKPLTPLAASLAPGKLSQESQIYLSNGAFLFHHTFDFFEQMFYEHKARQTESRETKNNHFPEEALTETGDYFYIAYKTSSEAATQNSLLLSKPLTASSFTLLRMLEQPRSLEFIMTYNPLPDTEQLISCLEYGLKQGWLLTL